MTQAVEMNFTDKEDEFIKLCEALNTRGVTTPVFLAFNHAEMPIFLVITPTIRAQFSWQDGPHDSRTAQTDYARSLDGEAKSLIARIEKFSFVIRPAKILWTAHDEVLSSPSDIPF